MYKPLHVWPVVREESLLVGDLMAALPDLAQYLAEDPALFALETMIWRQPPDTAILSNRIRFNRHGDNRLLSRTARPDRARELSILVDLSGSNIAARFQSLVNTFLMQAPDGSTTSGWILCQITRQGVILHNPSVTKSGKDEEWRRALEEESALPAERLREMVQCGHFPVMGRQVATLLTIGKEQMSAHERLKEGRQIESHLQLHIERVCTLMPAHRRLVLHPEWTPPSHRQ